VLRDIKLTRWRSGGSPLVHPAKCKAYAVAEERQPRFLIAHLAAPVNVAKGIAAMVRGGLDFEVYCDSVGHSQNCPHGYSVAITRLPKFSTAQVLIVSKDPQLLVGGYEQALWDYCKGDQITTPLMDQWQESIAESVERFALVRQAGGFGIEARIARFDSQRMDKLVSGLLSKRKIKI